MGTRAAKGRKLFSLAALCVLVAAVLAPTPASASRTLPRASAPDLERLPALELAGADAAGQAELLPLYTFVDVVALDRVAGLDDDQVEAEVARQRHRLHLVSSGLARPGELVWGSKTATGVSTSPGADKHLKGGDLRPKSLRPSFQGLWTDPVSGLSYARNRWYDARSASWLSEDPMGAVDSVNLYAFVGWGPHVGTDPMGRCLGLDDRPCSEVADAIDLSIEEDRRQRGYTTSVSANIEKALVFPVTFFLRLGRGEGRVFARVEGALQGHHDPDVRTYADAQREVNEASLEMLEVLGDVALLYPAGRWGVGFLAKPAERTAEAALSSLGRGALTTAEGESARVSVAAARRSGLGDVVTVTATAESAGGRVTLADYGLRTIAEDQAVLNIWNDTLRWAAKGDNAYTKYLNSPTIKSANRAWQETISPEFLKRMRRAGYDVSEVHHWNWPRSNFVEHVFDARHLVPIPRSRPGLHWDVHRALTSHPNPNPNTFPPWDAVGSPIRPEHVIDFPNVSSPLVAQ